ncbi:hypothetical protein [uncultured Acetatifactor sp.]|uniref:hypothetical protein n=1 Tax=uncultured Acetatifactor sp. TaxID=1671927 RepID=UPI0026186D75|nr:hypothetical protein [uncultured Acetatifactor sp.]
MKLGIMKWTGRDRQRVWIVVEYRRVPGSPGDRIRLAKARRRRWAAARRLAGKVFWVMLRALAAAWVTYLYTARAMEQALLQRGYRAYGGECLVIPFVFYGVFKAIRLAERAVRAARQWASERKGMVCREKGIPEAARPRK